MPKTSDKTTISIYTNRSLSAFVKAQAQARNQSKSSYIEWVLMQLRDNKLVIAETQPITHPTVN